MKLTVFLTLLVSLKAYSQNGDAIIGKWIKANKEDLIIEVFKTGGEYSGKVNWSKDNKKPAGFNMLDKLRFNEKEKKWKGIVHDPKSGRSYDAIITMKGDGSIEVKTSVMFFTIERVFKRVV